MIYLIGQTYIRQNSPITANVQDKDLFPHIIAAQELYTQKLLGSEFYNVILDSYSAQTLSGSYATLVSEYIKPQVLWRTLDFALPWIATNLRGKGLVQNTDDNAIVATPSDMRYLRNEARDRAEFQENLLWKYLCKNRELFPEFVQQTNPLVEPLKDNDNLFDSGVVFY